MSKGNLFLGFGRGKVGDVVFSRTNGEQVTRARNRAPRNPQTPLQLLQRVVMKTNASAYSLMQDICDHSFQGCDKGTPNQSEFVRANVRLMREQLATIINSGSAADILTSDEANFSMRGQSTVCLNPYLISDGSIQPSSIFKVELSGTGASTNMNFVINLLMTTHMVEDITTLTYADMCDVIGCEPGDQITLCWLTTDDTANALEPSTANSFGYCRFIMSPADGDMTKAFFGALSEGSYPINDPNPKNEMGNYTFYNVSGKIFVQDFRYDAASGATNTIAAAGIIISRKVGEVWQRSRCRLTLRPSDSAAAGHLSFDGQTLYLGDAVRSFQTEAGSLLYLNQAED